MEQEREEKMEGKGGETSAAVGRPGKVNPLILVILVILVAVIAVMAVFILRQKPEEPGTGNVILDETNADAVMGDMEQQMEEGMYAVKMNSQWNFPDGKSESTDAYVANSEENHKTVYFDVTLRETGEEVYKSPELPTGSAIKGFKLDKELEKGEYPAYCNYHLLNPDGEEFSSVSIEVELKILN